MTWIRIDSHRINAEEIVRYSPILVADESTPEFHTEIEFSNGGSVYVRMTPEEVDAYIIAVNNAQK